MTKIDDVSSGSTSGSRPDARRTLKWRDPVKHRLFCNPDRRGVEFIAQLAAALDDLGGA